MKLRSKATAVRLLAAATVAASTVFIAPGAAFAYSFEWDDAVADSPGSDYLECTSTTGSYVCFQPYGDKIWVLDTKADGYSAVARWYTDYGRWGTCRNSLGSDQWGVCNKDMAEDGIIYYRASRYDGDTDTYVGPESALATTSIG